jgi:hypothetical protein
MDPGDEPWRERYAKVASYKEGNHEYDIEKRRERRVDWVETRLES